MWQLSVPIKVKCFVWLVLKDRFIVKDMLSKLANVQTDESVCLLCNEDIEDSKHLFVHYARVYRVQGRVAKLWNLNFVWAGDITTTLNVWFHSCLSY